MQEIVFETHNNLDPDFPLIFGTDFRALDYKHDVYLHWHENIELIYCAEGAGWVLSGVEHISMKEGDLVVINSGNLHDIDSDSYCRFYYLDIGEALFDPFNIKLNQATFQNCITDNDIKNIAEKIISEITQKKIYYKQVIHIEIARLVMLLLRKYSLNNLHTTQKFEDRRIAMIKNAIRFIQENYCETIQIERICQHVGFSKFYFCRTFKEITGFTVTQYVNQMRCQHARNLLRSGKYNVSESAIRSGFNNISYFTKIFKTCFGVLPSNFIDLQSS